MVFWFTVGVVLIHKTQTQSMCLHGNKYSFSASENGPTPSSGTKRRSAMRTDEATMTDIKSMTALMAASDWRDRQKGLAQFQEMTESIPATVGNHIVKVTTPTLVDGHLSRSICISLDCCII